VTLKNLFSVTMSSVSPQGKEEKEVFSSLLTLYKKKIAIAVTVVDKHLSLPLASFPCPPSPLDGGGKYFMARKEKEGVLVEAAAAAAVVERLYNVVYTATVSPARAPACLWAHTVSAMCHVD